MPTTPPTIVAPMPDDPRVIALAKSLGLSRREAFGAAAEAWAWMSRVTKDGFVVKADPDTLDGFVVIDGFAVAMVDAGLVGVVDGGLVLPAELRLDRSARAGRGADDEHDAAERKKAQDRKRSRERYWRNKLNKPASQPSPQPVVEPAGPRPQPRSLGMLAGHTVMLLYRRDGVPFYKLLKATPKEFTGTVTDPDNPSLEDAVTAIHAAMLRESRKGLDTDGESFRPALSVVAAAAGIDTSVTDVPAPARAASPAKKLPQKSAPVIAPNPAEVVANTRRPPPPLREGRRIRDDDDAPATAEREISRRPHALTRENAKPHADLTLTGEHVPVASPCDDNVLGALQPHAKPHAGLTPAAPSSSCSSSSSSLSQEREEEKSSRDESITTTREPEAAEHDATIRRRKRFERYAAALNTTVDAVEWQSRFDPETLRTRLSIAGITPGASSEPAGRLSGIGMATEPTRQDEPATGILVAPVTIDHERDDIAAASPDARDDDGSPANAAALAEALG